MACLSSQMLKAVRVGLSSLFYPNSNAGLAFGWSERVPSPPGSKLRVDGRGMPEGFPTSTPMCCQATQPALIATTIAQPPALSLRHHVWLLLQTERHAQCRRVKETRVGHLPSLLGLMAHPSPASPPWENARPACPPNQQVQPMVEQLVGWQAISSALVSWAAGLQARLSNWQVRETSHPH